MTFTKVTRPGGTSNVPDALIKALVETEKDGNAVAVKLTSAADFTTWQANVRAKLRTAHNLRLRTKFNKVSFVVTCWAEKFADDRTAETFNDADLGVEDNDDTNEENLETVRGENRAQ